MFKIPANDWAFDLESFFQSKQGKKLLEKLNQQKKNSIPIYPPEKFVLNAFFLTPPKKVKIVILGQDPYHKFNQADGLAFSTQQSNLPPSLKNILFEASDGKLNPPNNGNLETWAKQGVLLLNTILTVEEAKPLSHQNWGWELLIEKILLKLDSLQQPICFMLWGANAEKMKTWITHSNRLILSTSHPSPLSAYRGFKGSGVFKKANEWLEKQNQTKIQWF